MLANVTRTYYKRSVPQFFRVSEFIHSMDRISPNIKVVVALSRFNVKFNVLLTKYVLLWKKVRSSGQYDRYIYTENSQYTVYTVY